MVEINCHSGYGVLSRILDLTLAQGARPARPGEFTLRAFLSGRIDLTQAEAVLEVIQARTDAGPQGGGGAPAGGLGRSVREAREALLDLLARVEAALDFPEEAEELPPESLRRGSAAQAGGLAAPGRHLPGRAPAQGGPQGGHRRAAQRGEIQPAEPAPERRTGPSSPRSPAPPGTSSRRPSPWRGVMVRLTDTAGLRPARDRLEALGIERTRDRLAQADLVLYLVDGSAP